MNFVKQNLFLLGTAAALVAASAVLLAFRSSAVDRAERAIKDRIRINNDMQALTSDGYINRAVVETAKRRVELMQQRHQQVAETVLAMNRRNYEVLMFEDPASPDKKLIPAFPIHRETYQAKGIRLLWPARIREEMKNLVESMQPTRPPTTPEVNEELGRSVPKGAGVSTEAPVEGAPPPRRVDDFYPYHRPGVAAAPRLTAETAPAKELTPDEEARRNLAHARARMGWIYVDEPSLSASLLSTAVNYTDDLMWDRQVALWVLRDIAAAINKTNAEVQNNAKEEKGVPSSAVKKLERVNVRGYVVKRGAPGASQQPDRREATASPAGGVSLTYLNPVGVAMSRPPELTGRACDQLRDVIHYDFTVLVSSSELLRLFRNLMLQNYHTVLDVKLETPGSSGRQAVGPERSGGSTEMYYYGTQNLVEATITAELQLLTTWTRGRRDEAAKDWDKKYPPLMPPLFLRRMAEVDASALRAEDNQRLTEAGMMPTGPEARTPGPRPEEPRPAGELDYRPEDIYRRGVR